VVVATPSSRCDEGWLLTASIDRQTGRLASLLDVPPVQTAQTVVPVAVTAGDRPESLRQWASGRCLLADRAGVYSRPEQAGTRARRIVREPRVN